MCGKFCDESEYLRDRWGESGKKKKTQPNQNPPNAPFPPAPHPPPLQLVWMD